LEKFTLSAITSGMHDAYIRQWATDAKKWGHPFFLRIGWEMNGGWFPWGEQAEGNHSGEFAPMWRHVHDIFTEVGAGNVSWIWCPNVDYAEGTPIDQLYPGDAYVDWTCMDGYNKGSSGNDNGKWKSFYQVFKKTYDQLLALAPDKPIMIGETSSMETGGSKADWITDALTTQLPVNFPKVKAMVWFNWNVDDAWGIESSGSALSAFSRGIASPYYAANEFSALDKSPIPGP
jgi:beta-mannanase